jgi:hypothetical protein
MSNRLKQITTKAKALYKSGKYSKWTDAIKAASKTLTHTVTKKAKKITKQAKKVYKSIGALPIDFKGSFLGYNFSIVNQYTLDGGVTAIFLDKEKVKILELNGNKNEEDRAINILSSRAKSEFSHDKGYKLDSRDESELNRRIKKFIQQLNKEVKDYNTGKDRNVKKSKPVKIKYHHSTKKLSLLNEIKSLLKNDHKILVRGYKLKAGKIREKISGIKKSPARSLHKDTASHNVRISVMSGIKDSIKEIETMHSRIAFQEGQLQALQNMLKHEKFDLKEKKRIMQNIKLVKLRISDYKKHLTSLKKHI